MKTAIITILLLVGSFANAQSDTTNFKNYVYLTGGVHYGSTFVLNYERVVFKSPMHKIMVGGEFGWTVMKVLWGPKNNGWSKVGKVGYLLGNGPHHLDVSVGYWWYFNANGYNEALDRYNNPPRTGGRTYPNPKQENYRQTFVAFSVGYRKQMEDNLIVRIGIGWPDGVYVSAGATF